MKACDWVQRRSLWIGTVTGEVAGAGPDLIVTDKLCNITSGI